MVEYELPASRREAIVKEFPDTGAQWIADYPRLLNTCVARWGLILKQSVTIGLPINMIYLAETETGDPRVLKIGHPHPEQLTEMKTLQLFKGRSAVRVFDADKSLGALLLERLMPGTTLRAHLQQESGNDPDIGSAMLLMRHLPLRCTTTNSAGLPRYADWMCRGFEEFRRRCPTDVEYLDFMLQAEEAYLVIESGSQGDYVLHGDLHHENILLDNHRGWVAIDPKGVIGPKVLECGRFLHNFLEDEVGGVDKMNLDQLCEILVARYQLFNDILGYEVSQLARAAFVDVTLGTCWMLNSNRSAEAGRLLARATFRLVADS